MSRKAIQTLILDDGQFYVALAAHQAPEGAVGFLERRCPVTSDAPNGHECLGAFTRSEGGGWTARISTEFDPRTRCEYQVLVAGVMRLEAIAALWQARRHARIPRQLRPSTR
jgi:hypothetical protein